MEAEIGAPALKPPDSANKSNVWIVGPVFDLLFFANLGWLLAFVPGFVVEGAAHIEFWQLYFLTTPHRWITLVLVATDADRREGRTWLFIALAAAAFAVVWGVWLVSGAFLCLFVLDYLWNGWHFASQHAGILRIYSRKAGDISWLEALPQRHGLRLFIFYVIGRTTGWATGWLEEFDNGLEILRGVDLGVLACPAVLLVLQCRPGLTRRRGEAIYLVSVIALYSALLLALRAGHTMMIIALTAAAATFHAVEYLALVTHYAWRRSGQTGENSLFLEMARRWLGCLAVYVVVLGLFAWLLEGLTLWLGLNLWAGLLHYAYDGLIWKLRRPATAQVLGAG